MVSAGKTILFVARCGESPCCSIVHVTPLWIVAYKAAGIHSVPLVSALENSFVNNDKAHKNENPTLLDFCAAQFPEIKLISGKKPVEGGLLHRLDFETQGLVLIARTDGAYKFLSDEQAAGRFVKEYEASCARTSNENAESPGFPPPPEGALTGHAPFSVTSGFRAWGKGRRAVRPVSADGSGTRRVYTTEILSVTENFSVDDSPGNVVKVHARLDRGFRHQVRCHLAWVGLPIDNDPLYGGLARPGGGFGLKAVSLEFTDPAGGGEVSISLG